MDKSGLEPYEMQKVSQMSHLWLKLVVTLHIHRSHQYDLLVLKAPLGDKQWEKLVLLDACEQMSAVGLGTDQKDALHALLNIYLSLASTRCSKVQRSFRPGVQRKACLLKPKYDDNKCILFTYCRNFPKRQQVVCFIPLSSSDIYSAEKNWKWWNWGDGKHFRPFPTHLVILISKVGFPEVISGLVMLMLPASFLQPSSFLSFTATFSSSWGLQCKGMKKQSRTFTVLEAIGT